MFLTVRASSTKVLIPLIKNGISEDELATDLKVLLK